ncbi:MAG: hypothetical protein QM628_16430 [Propionicimonas sp.]
MKIATAIAATIAIWCCSVVPASADPVEDGPGPQGIDQTICKIFPQLCPR